MHRYKVFHTSLLHLYSTSDPKEYKNCLIYSPMLTGLFSCQHTWASLPQHAGRQPRCQDRWADSTQAHGPGGCRAPLSPPSAQGCSQPSRCLLMEHPSKLPILALLAAIKTCNTSPAAGQMLDKLLYNSWRHSGMGDREGSGQTCTAWHAEVSLVPYNPLPIQGCNETQPTVRLFWSTAPCPWLTEERGGAGTSWATTLWVSFTTCWAWTDPTKWHRAEINLQSTPNLLGPVFIMFVYDFFSPT